MVTSKAALMSDVFGHREGAIKHDVVDFAVLKFDPSMSPSRPIIIRAETGTTVHQCELLGTRLVKHDLHRQFVAAFVPVADSLERFHDNHSFSRPRRLVAC
jgi:hypothetical protein